MNQNGVGQIGVMGSTIGAQPRLNENLSSSPTIHNDDVLHVEDYDANLDADFIRDKLTPYLTDLYKDLLMRSNQ